MVIYIRCSGVLSPHLALRARLLIQAQRAWRVGSDACGATIADKVALVEELDQCVFAVAGDGARVADAGCFIRFSGVRWRRVAGQTGVELLTERSEGFGACVKGLMGVSVLLAHLWLSGGAYVWKSLARVFFELELAVDEPAPLKY